LPVLQAHFTGIELTKTAATLDVARSQATRTKIVSANTAWEITDATADVIAGLGSAAAWPVVARAQQPTVPVIGLLSPQAADDDFKSFTVPFLQGLMDTGYVEGKNMAVEYRYADNQMDRLQALAADLVRRRVAVIAAAGTPAALAAKAATTTIPIVFTTGVDPVALGLVASLNRPGENLTGVANLGGELTPKQLQLLHSLMPNAGLFGVLADPAYPATQSVIADLQAAARTLGLQVVVVNARSDRDLETAFRNFSATARWCGPRGPKYLLQSADGTTRGTGSPPCIACDLLIP